MVALENLALKINRIIKYEDNAVEQKSIKVKKINSQNIRLIIKDGKYKIYWKKKS